MTISTCGDMGSTRLLGTIQLARSSPKRPATFLLPFLRRLLSHKLLLQAHLLGLFRCSRWLRRRHHPALRGAASEGIRQLASKRFWRASVAEGARKVAKRAAS